MFYQIMIKEFHIFTAVAAVSITIDIKLIHRRNGFSTLTKKLTRSMCMNDFLNRYDRIQRLSKPLQPEREPKMKAWMWSMIGMVLVLVYVGINLIPSAKPIQNTCNECHVTPKAKLHNYFYKNGAKNPEALAVACLATESPRLLASMAKTEGMKIDSRKGGYKGRHQGAWQVNPKYWGKVSHDPVRQAKQVESILYDLLDNQKDIESALNYYGGDETKKQYAKDILAELQNVPNLN
jgi:hypothetical protein